MILYKINEKGSTKIYIGIFRLSDDGKDVLFFFKDSEEPISRDVFLTMYGKSYVCTHPVRGAIKVSLDNPEQYLENLIYRFSGYTWIEKE